MKESKLMEHVVYKIVYKVTDELVYVGYSSDYTSRKYNHFSLSAWVANPKSKLYKEFISKGKDNFKIDIIQSFDNKREALDKERSLINSYKPKCNDVKQYQNIGEALGVKTKIKNIVTGEELEFMSMNEASKYLETNFSNIQRTVRGCNKKRTNVKGWLVSQGDKPDWDKLLETYFKYSSDSKAVRRIDNQTGIAKDYRTVREAVEDIEPDESKVVGKMASVNAVARGTRKSYLGFTWEYITWKNYELNI